MVNTITKTYAINEIIKYNQKNAVKYFSKIGIYFIFANSKLNDKYENNTETINSIQKYCEENLAKYMIPKKFIVIKEFPKTMIGKIDYKELEKMYKGDK